MAGGGCVTISSRTRRPLLLSRAVDSFDIINVVLVVVLSSVVGFVLYKLNSAVRLLNNRLNIISHTQASLIREVKERLSTQIDDSQSKREAELRRRLDKDFR